MRIPIYSNYTSVKLTEIVAKLKISVTTGDRGGIANGISALEEWREGHANGLSPDQFLVESALRAMNELEKKVSKKLKDDECYEKNTNMKLAEIIADFRIAVHTGNLGVFANGVSVLEALTVERQQKSTEKIEGDEFYYRLLALEECLTPQQHIASEAEDSPRPATMSEEALMASADQLLGLVHEYEVMVVMGSDRQERMVGRRAKDNLIEVCCEIGVRHLGQLFQDKISKHLASYRPILEHVGAEEDQMQTEFGRLSWWNV